MWRKEQAERDKQQQQEKIPFGNKMDLEQQMGVRFSYIYIGVGGNTLPILFHPLELNVLCQGKKADSADY